tara:strand:- start:10511 stop:12331 length:1821 start_codon:yes stop_codon:yes gene_type:complete
MPTLASPQTVTVTASSPSQVYRVKCLGASDVMQVSWVGGGGISGQQTIRATAPAGQDVGPFQDETTITFAALAGSPVYEYSGPVMLEDSGSFLAGDQLIVANGVVSDGIVVMGDSIPTYNFMPIVLSTVTDNGNGTATATGTSLQTYAGEFVQIESSPTAKLNVVGAPVLSHVITAGNVTSITYRYEGYPYNDLGQTGSLLMRLVRRESDQGFLTLAKFLADARFRILGTFAIGGLDSEQMETMLDAAIALRPRAIAIQVGTNNVYARVWAADRTISSFKRIADKISKAGIVPVFGLILPRVDGQQSSTRAAQIAPVHRWLRDYLPSVGGYCVETWGKTANAVTFADMTSTIGAASANMLGDNVHPARIGAWAMAKAWLSVLTQVFPAKVRLPTNPTDALAANGKSFLPNVLLTGTGGTKSAGSGTISGNAPDGCAVNIVSGTPTVTLSQVARTEAADGDASGNWFRLVITAAASGTTVQVRMAVTPGNWSYGDLVQGGMRIRTSSSGTPGTGAPSKMATPELLVNVTTATSGTDISYAIANQVPGIEIDEAYSGVSLTPAHAFKPGGAGIHGSLSYMRLDLNLIFRGAGSATVDIAHPMLGTVNQ